jgi:transposase
MKFSTIKSKFMQTQFNELTDAQWLIITPFLPMKRKRKQDLRDIVNAVFFVCRTGVQWRNLDTKFPYWQIVYYYFRTWTAQGVFDKLNEALVKSERLFLDKNPEPSANTIDSQSVKIAPFIPDHKGIDGNKKINGRKRHVITDTLGLIIAVIVTAANKHDGITGCQFFNRFAAKIKRTQCIFADDAYKVKFTENAEQQGIKVEIAARPENAKGFVPVKKRWVAERTFAWMNAYRRLAKDYERTVQCSESMIYLAQIQILLHRITLRPI